MFEIDGKEYELKFNIERIKLVENFLKLPTVADIVQTNGALSINSFSLPIYSNLSKIRVSALL